MKLIRPYFEIITQINREAILKKIELCGRVCYKSEDKITANSGSIFVKSVKANNHFSVLEHEIITVKIVCDRGCCYDDKTKVLTDIGWKFFKDLQGNELFYSMNDEGNIVKIKAEKIIVREYEGTMQLYSSTQINLLVTPNHNMWVFDYNKRAEKSRIWKFIESNDIKNGKYVFSKTANPTNKKGFEEFKIPGIVVNRGFYKENYSELVFEANLFFELLGWWITDGSISYGKKGSGHRLVISQTKVKGRKRIKELLNKLNLHFLENEKEFRISCPQLLKWIADNFLHDDDCKKTYYCFIPRWFFTNLSCENLESFLNGIIGGDGSSHKGGKGYQIYTASEQFAEDILELCLNIGKAANIYKKSGRNRMFPNGKYYKCVDHYIISVLHSKTALFDKRKAEKKDISYKGNVYCVELPLYHKLFVMREGKSCWCGNSHELVRHRIASFSQESTRYCNYSKNKFGNQLTFIIPVWLHDLKEGQYYFISTANFNYVTESIFGKENFEIKNWLYCLYVTENGYLQLLDQGWTPQQARSVLPNSLKTEIVITANLREWQHIFSLRCANDAHPQMREIMLPLRQKFSEYLPELF